MRIASVLRFILEPIKEICIGSIGLIYPCENRYEISVGDSGTAIWWIYGTANSG